MTTRLPLISLLAMLGLGVANAQVEPQAPTIDNLNFGPKQTTQGKSLDSIVAVVGQDVITRREINQHAHKDKQAALQALIMEKLLLQEAARRNIVISDTAINVANQSKQATDRSIAKKQLIISRLQGSVANQLVTVSNREINDFVEKQLRNINQTVDLEDVLILVPKSATNEMLQQAQSKTQEIIAQLKTQSPQAVAKQYPDVRYTALGWVELAKIPPSFSKELMDTPTNVFAKPIVDNDGIHILRIKARKGEKSAPKAHTETLTSHILVKNSKSAKKDIEKLYRQLKKGKDFAKIASYHSQDFGSAASGGSLGWVQRGQMVPDFEKVMNQTAPGQISQPFKTRYGYHILKVMDRRKIVTNNRKALEQKARQAIFRRKANEEWNLWLQRLREEAYVEIRQ